jgi:exopolysaccharide production protein ExoQ
LGVDPPFTGRTNVWNVVYQSVEQRPWIGWGFGVFFEPTGGSPYFKLADTDFLRAAGHAHSGFMNILAEGGWGAAIFTLVAISFPIARYHPPANINYGVVSGLLALWFFAIFRNALEGDLFQALRPTWIVILAVSLLCAEKQAVQHERGACDTRRSFP